MRLPRVSLGRSELTVSGLCLGMADYGTRVSVDEGLRLIETFLEAGGDFLDTAHIYGAWVPGRDGASDRFVGEAVRRFGRDRFVIASKGGHCPMGDWYPRPDAFLTPELVAGDLEEGLERMAIDQLDVFYLHRDDPRVPVGELVDLMNTFRAKGLVRVLGASNWSAVRVRAANEYAATQGLQPFSVVENQWSLARPVWTPDGTPGEVRWVQDDEVGVFAECGITLAPYSATANGYFAGREVGQMDNEANRARRDWARDEAARLGLTPTQVALRWLLDHPLPVVPIVGTGDMEHLREAIAAIAG